MLHPLRLGHVGALDQACLSFAPPRYTASAARGLLSVLDVQLFRPEQLNQRPQPRQPWPWAGGRSVVVGATHLLAQRDLADGWEWRQPLPSDRFASAVLSWFVLPWHPGQCRKPAITTPEDPSVRLVWDPPPKRKVPNPLAGQSRPRVRADIPGSFGSFVHPRAPSHCCPCIAHAAGKSIPPSPSLIPSCHQAFCLGSLTFYPAYTLSFHPFFLPQGWPLSLSLHRFQRFSVASPFTGLHVLVTID